MMEGGAMVRGTREGGHVWFRAECAMCSYRSSPVVTSAAAHRLLSLHTKDPAHVAAVSRTTGGTDA